MATNSEPRGVRASSAGLDAYALVRRPVTELAGVSKASADVLTKLGVTTIFDLGASQLFAGATVIAAAQLPDSLVGRFGLVPNDLVVDAARLLPLAQLADTAISNLRGISTSLADEFVRVMGIATVQDLASWPPYLAARDMVGIASGGSDDLEATQTEQLQPRLGQYPTERVYFSTLALLQMQGNTDRQVDLAGAISLTDIPAGFSQPAVGALLTYSQSWVVQGVTLGQLLHSVALAPGEATRIAVIDWSRRTAATASEDIGETERLDNTTNHARTVSEVQSAVAEDFQAGGSRSSASSSSDSTATADASGTGLIESLFESADSSDSTQSASTNSNASSSSWSSGNRSVLANMLQNVNDLTEQHSASARNRRATSVREVSQSEHEEVSTRIVANYNHMHALTVQYFEVVQLYRIVSELHRVDRCLFVPLELLDFSGDAGAKTIERWRAALKQAALSRRVQSLLADDTTAIELMPIVPVRSRFGRMDFARAVKTAMAHRVVRPGAEVIADAAQRPVPPPATDNGAVPPAPVPAPAAPPAPSPSPSVADAAPVLRLWDERLARVAAKLLDRPIFRRGSDSLFVPEDTELVAVSFDSVHLKSVTLDRGANAAAADQIINVPADASMIDVVPPQRLIELDGIALAKMDAAAVAGTMTLHCLYLGRALTLPAVPLLLTAGTATQRVLTFRTDRADRQRELAKHLQAHRDHYSRAVFRALDSTTLTLLLSRFKWNGKPLIEQVEPTPVSVAGNYVILRAPVDVDEDSGIVENKVPLKWGDLLKRRGVEPGKQRDERVVPIQTGGVFAEAVLGRANSAEKLDITRFWNWQDSPIPLTPTEIAPVASGSRGTNETLTPGQLSAPVLNVMPATQVPDPAGVGAALSAIANMNFRDMSGLAGTQVLSQAALAGTLDAATAAGTLASENMKTEAQKAVAMGQIAADIAKAAIGASGGGRGQLGGAASNISEAGALFNHARKLDERAARTNNSPTTNIASDDPGGSPVPFDDSSLDQRSRQSSGPAFHGSSREDAMLQRITSGPMEQVTGESLKLIDKAMSSIGVTVSFQTKVLSGVQPDTPEHRAFFPKDRDPKSGLIALRCSSSAPSGSTQIWTEKAVEDGLPGGFLIADNQKKPLTQRANVISYGRGYKEIIAMRPGLTNVLVEEWGPTNATQPIDSLSAVISVPQFVLVTAEPEFDTYLKSVPNLATHKSKVLTIAQSVCDAALSTVNVRTLWNIAGFANEVLPVQLRGGGKFIQDVIDSIKAGFNNADAVTALFTGGAGSSALNFVIRATLGGASSATGIETEFGTPPLAGTFETFRISTGALGEVPPSRGSGSPAGVYADVVLRDLVDQLAVSKKNIDFVVTVFGRLIGQALARSIGTAMNANDPQGPLKFEAESGWTIESRTGFATSKIAGPFDPSDFTDAGIDKIAAIDPTVLGELQAAYPVRP